MKSELSAILSSSDEVGAASKLKSLNRKDIKARKEQTKPVENDEDDALAGGKVPKSGMLSVKRKHGADADAATPEKKSSKKDKKGDKGHKSKGGKTPKSSSKKSKHKA